MLRWVSRSVSAHSLVMSSIFLSCQTKHIGVAVSVSASSLTRYVSKRRRRAREIAEGARDYVPRPIELRSDEIVEGIVGLIGRPLMYLISPSPFAKSVPAVIPSL